MRKRDLALLALVTVASCTAVSTPQFHSVFVLLGSAPTDVHVQALRSLGADSVVLIPRPAGVYAQGRIAIGDISTRVPNFTSLIDFGSSADPVVSVFIRTPDFPTDSDAAFLRAVGAHSVGISAVDSVLSGVMQMQYAGRLGSNSRFVSIRVAPTDQFPQQ